MHNDINILLSDACKSIWIFNILISDACKRIWISQYQIHPKHNEYPNIRFMQMEAKKEYLPSSTSKSTGSANVKDREVAFSSENKALVFN